MKEGEGPMVFPRFHRHKVKLPDLHGQVIAMPITKDGEMMIIIECPHCGKEIEPIKYGQGWVAVCCDRVIFNSRQLPPNYQKNCKNHFIATESDNQG